MIDSYMIKDDAQRRYYEKKKLDPAWREKSNARCRRYHSENKSKNNARSKRWHSENREKAKAYKLAHKESLQAKQKLWRQSNLARLAEKQREYRKANPESVRRTEAKRNNSPKRIALRNQIWRRWKSKHPDKVRASYHKRRAAKSKVNTFTAEDLLKTRRGQRGLCYYCGKKLDNNGLGHIEHREFRV